MQVMGLIFKPNAKRIVAWMAILAALAIVFCLANPGVAGATNTEGEKTSTLTIKFNNNGDVTTAATFTVDDMRQMPQKRYVYSTMDNGANVIFNMAEGVLLTGLLEKAGIDTKNAYEFKFTATDDYSRTLTGEYLLNTPRYYYPGLKENSMEGAIPVEPLLALKAFEVSDQDQLDFDLMDDYYSVRLFFGQAEDEKITNKNFVKWVEQIEVFAPPAGANPPSLTDDMVNIAAGQAVSITFTDDQTWRKAITGITVDGISIEGRYTVDAGVITIEASVFGSDKDYLIVVKATGYQDAAVKQHKGSWPVVFSVDGNAAASRSFTMADLRMMPPATVKYGAETCKGVYLKDLLTGYDHTWQVQINVTDAATFPIAPVKVCDLLDPANKYLLTYDINGQPIKIGSDNQTLLRIYWGLGTIYKNVTGITITDVFKNWPREDTPVPVDKPWTIRFNHEVSTTQSLGEHIYVTDSAGEKVNVTCKIGMDQKTVEVLPAGEGYCPGTSYTLWIEGSLQSKAGKQLKQPVKLQFTTERGETSLKPVNARSKSY